MKLVLAMIGWGALCAVSTWGWPWNLPVTLIGGMSVGAYLAREKLI